MGFRRLITVLALAAALPAAGQTKFVFSPQWMAQAQFAGFYVAKDMGLYDEEGLDVEIRHPFSTQTLENRVREGKSQAYSMSLSQAMEMVDKGIPLVNILQTSMNSSLVIVSRYGADPFTLRNAKVLTWRAGLGQIPKSVAARENLDYRWITASSSLNLFVAGAVDATLATTYNEYYQLLQTGLITPGKGIYRFSEHGYNIQEDGVYMTAAAYGKDRDSAERFARASRRGWEWAAEHPDETLEIVMKYVKEYRIPTNRVLQQLMLEEVLRLQLDPDSGEREFRLRPDMVDKVSGLMLEGGIIKKEVKYEQLLP
jgi:NitT/TauT family transport system substrate-binding protein